MNKVNYYNSLVCDDSVMGIKSTMMTSYFQNAVFASFIFRNYTLVSLIGAESRSADVIIAVSITFGIIIIVILPLLLVIVSAVVAHKYCRKDKGKY